MRRAISAALLVSCLSLTACGGGSSSTASLPHTRTAARKLVVAVTGTASLSTVRRTQSLTGTGVSVTLSGRAVGSGQLDASGKASIEIDEDVPPGSTLLITAGSMTASIVWNQTNQDAAVLIQVNADGSLTVTVASGDEPEERPADNDPNGSTSTQDGDGTPTMVDDGDDNAALPANLPITVSATCTQITITPTSSKIAAMRFEENLRDGDGGNEFRYQGPFSAAMTFPLIAQGARIEIRIFDSEHSQLLDVKAPINAFTAQPGQPTPAPCPSPSPNVTASPSASPSPSPSA